MWFGLTSRTAHERAARGPDTLDNIASRPAQDDVLLVHRDLYIVTIFGVGIGGRAIGYLRTIPHDQINPKHE